jgi:DnaK suppressor protein
MREQKLSLKMFKDELTAKQQELCMRIERRRNEIMVDRDPDDEGARAVDQASRDFAAFNMEREMRTLAEIESSLRRLASGNYGICASCDAEIPVARLEALPWTRLCVDCAGRGIERDPRPSQPSLGVRPLTVRTSDRQACSAGPSQVF